MELYRRMPTGSYKDAGYHRGELCSNCGHNEYEDILSRNVAVRRRRTRSYGRHCPSCHCPSERRRSPSGRPRTSENLDVMLNRYERIPAQPISSTIKKSQSSPLSQKVCWHDCQAGVHPRYLKNLLQARRQRRSEHVDKHPPGLFRMKGDTLNSELNNEDAELCSRCTQPVLMRSSLKKHSRCRKPEGSPDEQEYSDAESEVSMKRAQYFRQPKKSYVENLGARRHCVDRDSEHAAEMRNESDADCRRDEHECQEVREPLLKLQDFRRLKYDRVAMNDQDSKKIEKRDLDIARETKKPGEAPYCITSELTSPLLKAPTDKPTRELLLNESAQSAKLDLQAMKNRILDSIDHVLGTMDDTKNDEPKQEQSEQDTVEKITRELQENGWQMLFNAFTIHRDSTDSSKRTVRLECLNHIRQQLDKLYALESTLDGYPPKSQSPSSHDVSCLEEHQQSHRLLEQKIVDS